MRMRINNNYAAKGVLLPFNLPKLISIYLFITLFAPSALFSDTVILKSGKKFENVNTLVTIDSIEIQFEDGTVQKFPKNQLRKLDKADVKWASKEAKEEIKEAKSEEAKTPEGKEVPPGEITGKTEETSKTADPAKTSEPQAKTDSPETKEPKDTKEVKDFPKDTGGIVVKGEKEKDIGRLADIQGTNIYAGKKNEVIQPDKLNANLATNMNRQLFAKVPGLMIQESDGTGIQTSVAVRGLNPNRSWEFNTRQNGYDIVPDPVGYPEAYYTPPTEAVEKIEVVRGSASLQYGPQFGGMLNYVFKKPNKDKKFTLETRNTAGSYGLFNSYNGVSGTAGKFSYFSFFHHRSAESWRQNGQYRTQTGHVHMAYNFTDNLKLGVEFTRNELKSQQPGGLLDGQIEYNPVLTTPGMNVNARQSNRSRNWFGLIWNIPAITLDYALNDNTKVSVKAFGLYGERPSMNFTSGMNVADSIDSKTLNYTPRQFDEDIYRTFGTEARFITSYQFLGIKNTTSFGVRYSRGNTSRIRNSNGTTGSSFDKTETNRIGDFVVRNGDLRFQNVNHAVYFEHMFNITNTFSVTPGVRYESITSEASGYANISTTPGANLNFRPTNPKTLNNRVLLGGLGLQYKLFETTNLYANYSQAFRPVLYSDLYAIGTTINDIDPNMKNQYGYNSDAGYRGKVKNFLNFDVGVFQLRYNNRVDTINGTNRTDMDAIAIKSLGGTPANLRTNVGDSLHRGVEAFVEFDPINYFMEKSPFGSISFYVSYAQIKATYIRWTAPTTSGLPDWDRIGNRVENAPDRIMRYGATYAFKSLFSLTYQVSKVSSAYSDATNTEYPTANAQAGKIPAYTVSDASFTYNITDSFGIRGGVNNIENRVYFTRRAGGLPGPGILPGDGRTYYLGMVATF